MKIKKCKVLSVWMWEDKYILVVPWDKSVLTNHSTEINQSVLVNM